ncbi:AMIN-like domain-containing (lipo)protein [Pseudonocardia sp. TRM90224]|uniref:AMIN-like domain-containing (lipo)protein n=1 Tax=Pseudonocardia sp. TRM90224 TaxID=2812678 RepID=UPI001E63E9BB|nr:hypothetical protein [Pseudonocardia sp. TRM90224]
MGRRLCRIALVVAAVAALVPASAAAAAEPNCGITWGSELKTAPAPARATAGTGSSVTDVRGEQQACFDRLVFDVQAAGRYYVEYVPEVSADATGDPVPLRGGAFLVVVAGNPAYDEAWNVTYHPADLTEMVDVTGWRTFRQVAWANSWEGDTTVGLGVRARLPFRVLHLEDPPRLVVDVAHQW